MQNVKENKELRTVDETKDWMSSVTLKHSQRAMVVNPSSTSRPKQISIIK